MTCAYCLVAKTLEVNILLSIYGIVSTSVSKNENNYSFNVLFDEMNDWNKRIATRYDVEALPTKIIIDKNGYIRYHSSGTSSSIDDIMDDLSTRIEIVKTL